MIDLFISILEFIFKLVVKTVAVGLIVVGLIVLLGFLLSLVIPGVMKGYSISTLYPLLFTSEGMMFLGITGVTLLITIPAMMLIFLGFRILMHGHRRRIKGLGVSLLGLWVLGIIFTVISSAKTVSDFQVKESVSKSLSMTHTDSNILFVEAKESGLATEIEEINYFGEKFIPSDSVYYVPDRVLLDIQKSESGEFELMQTLVARGNSRASAKQRAASIGYSLNQDDSAVALNDYITIPVDDHFRNQRVRLILKVPEGKSVFLAPSTTYMLDDVKNVHEMYERNMAGHTWLMNPEGLTCTDCDSSDFEEGSFPKGNASRMFDIKDFSEISIEGMFNLDIRQGSEFKVLANGSQRFIDHLDISKSGNKLEIEMTHGGGYIGKQRGTITIVLPTLKWLEIAGATQSVISGFNEEKMRIEVLGASKVDMKADIKELEMEVAGASKVTLTGKGEKFNIELNGASKLDAFGYEVANCTVEVNGTGKAEVNATKELTAEANGSSEILYKSYDGLPQTSSDVTGISSIKPVHSAK